MPLGKVAAPGALETALIVTPFELELEFEAKCPASPPTRAATRRSETRVDQGERLERDWDDKGAGSGSTSGAGAGTGEGCSD
jgi:hypothetical protein